ncbi:MAG: hypothetical protein KDB70_13965 [Mycobacterium sp.]|jgi:hypothetical protein|nr:hypothetical protein [Mycobacterium sp.]
MDESLSEDTAAGVPIVEASREILSLLRIADAQIKDGRIQPRPRPRRAE